jgi:hypothetical protein
VELSWFGFAKESGVSSQDKGSCHESYVFLTYLVINWEQPVKGGVNTDVVMGCRAELLKPLANHAAWSWRSARRILLTAAGEKRNLGRVQSAGM